MVRYIYKKFLNISTVVHYFRNYILILFIMYEHKKKLISGWSNEFLPQLPEYNEKLPVSDVVLGIIGIAGIVSIAILAPNAVQILKYVEPKRWKKNNPRYRISETLQRFIKDGILALDHVEGETPHVRLTKKGRMRFEKLQFYKNSPEPWDGKWRIVMFDVIEKRRKIRNHLRVELRNIGFRKLQNSVWVYPYDCEEVLALLKTDLKLGYEALYFVTEKMGGDAYLRRLFFLPKQT